MINPNAVYFRGHNSMPYGCTSTRWHRYEVNRFLYIYIFHHVDIKFSVSFSDWADGGE